MSQDKKRVAWITVPAFISTDRFIIPEMAKHYQIDWYLIAKSTETIDFIDTIIDLSKEHDFTLTRINLDHRNISLSTASDYKKFLIGIKNKDYDLVYNVMIGVPYYMPLLRKIIGNKKVLVAIHNVHVPKGGSMYLPSLAYTYYTICKFNYFQTFSVSQKNALLQKHSTKYCDNVNFVLMDYGKSSLIRNDRI